MIADCLLKRNDTTVVTYVSKFRPHLLGKQFTLRTDHGALLWLHKESSKNLTIPLFIVRASDTAMQMLCHGCVAVNGSAQFIVIIQKNW